ncbi:MAG: Uma2 family endonuclease [Candidatus Xenobia bacterium]
MALKHAPTKRWTVEEFHRLFDEGFFSEDDRVELIEGEIVPMPKQNPPHSGAVLRSTKRLVLAFHETHEVACQLPLDLSEYSEPFPDFAIIPNEKAIKGHLLETADLVIEVSDSRLKFDRGEKASLYARYGIPEYWVLNVKAEQMEVHRNPQPDKSAAFGFSWGTREVVARDGEVSPLCRPDVRFKVADLL